MILPKVGFNGDQFWYKDGYLHRIDGPSEIWSDGSQFFWHRDGKLNRVGGPAVMWSDGTQFWYKDGVKYDPS